MSDSTTSEQAAAIQESIRCVLYDDWDPIGVNGHAPHDEYDSYIGDVYRILAGSRSETELINFLSKVEIESMGLGQPSPEKLKQHLEWHKLVANKLLALDVKLHGRH